MSKNVRVLVRCASRDDYGMRRTLKLDGLGFSRVVSWEASVRWFFKYFVLVRIVKISNLKKNLNQSILKKILELDVPPYFW